MKTAEELMEGADAGIGWVRGLSMAEVRKRDLMTRRLRQRAKPFNRPPRRGWSMFEQEGTVNDGVWERRCCVYPESEDDRVYSTGLWFLNDVVAAKVRDWKMAREKHRPWVLTRTIVRAWRGLPWR